ncbi:MAG: hypothetical protein CR975_06285 [Gammaproteobacteria bacterium]|nr:MAG: hypothetical protein CR975_06285 [Gammaproteobacteria bacterium]
MRLQLTQHFSLGFVFTNIYCRRYYFTRLYMMPINAFAVKTWAVNFSICCYFMGQLWGKNDQR